MRQIIKKHTVVVIFFVCTTIHYSGSAIHLYENRNSNPVSLSDSLLEQSWNLRNADPEYALHLSIAAIEHARESKDHYNLAKAHSFAGVATRIMGDYNRAIEYFFEGLHLSKKHHIPEQEGYAYINISNLYLYLQYYNQALENLEEALKIALEIDNKNMLGYIYLYQGRAEMNLHDYEKAIESINKSLEIRKEQNNVAGQAVNYKYLGDLCLQTNRESEALIYYEKAINSTNSLKDKDLLGNIYIKIAQIYCRDQNFEQAVEMAKRSIEIGKQTQAKPIVLDALKILEKDAMNEQNFRQANHYQKQIQLYQDSIFNQQINEKVLVLEFEMERQKKQAEIELMEKEKEIKSLNLSKQKQTNRILIGFLVLFFMGGMILFVLLKKIETKNKLLYRQKEELRQTNLAKNKMLMIIGHDLRNPVWNLKALLEIFKEEYSFEDEGVNESILAMSRSAQSISDLLENLLFWAKSQEGRLIFNPEEIKPGEILTKTLHDYEHWARLKNIKIDKTINQQCTIKGDVQMISAVFRNLISNAIKFSHKGGTINIELHNKESNCVFSVKDHGIGFQPQKLQKIQHRPALDTRKGTGNEPGSGIGLTLCFDFIEKHGGKLHIESQENKGSIFSFSIPVFKSGKEQHYTQVQQY